MLIRKKPETHKIFCSDSTNSLRIQIEKGVQNRTPFFQFFGFIYAVILLLVPTGTRIYACQAYMNSINFNF